jgi:hypothetical protein
MFTVRFCLCLPVDNASSTEWFPIDVSYPSRPLVKATLREVGNVRAGDIERWPGPAPGTDTSALTRTTTSVRRGCSGGAFRMTLLARGY